MQADAHPRASKALSLTELSGLNLWVNADREDMVGHIETTFMALAGPSMMKRATVPWASRHSYKLVASACSIKATRGRLVGHSNR
jgi:hypothetical protein